MSNQENQRTLYTLLGQARELLASQIDGPLPASPVQQNRPQPRHPDPQQQRPSSSSSSIEANASAMMQSSSISGGNHRLRKLEEVI